MTVALEGSEWPAARPRPHFTPGKDPVPILQEAGWAPGPVWTGGKSRPHWDSIPDRPASSQSLYQLSYRAHPTGIYGGKKGSGSGFSLCMSIIFVSIILPMLFYSFFICILPALYNLSN